MSRSELRVQTMTILYQIFLYKKNNLEYDLDVLLDDEQIKDKEFVARIVKGVLESDNKLDELANKYLDNWRLDRLGLTDQAIIKIAIYEMLYTDTPNKVCINESIELAKQYSDESVVKMINAALDKILHNEVKDAE